MRKWNLRLRAEVHCARLCRAADWVIANIRYRIMIRQDRLPSIDEVAGEAPRLIPHHPPKPWRPHVAGASFVGVQEG